MKHFYQIDAEEALDRLDSTIEGLQSDEVKRRRNQYGSNEIVDRHGRDHWQILWEQFNEPMVWLLLSATVVSVIIHEYLDAGAIGAIILLNAVLGFVQDFRAEKAMAALKELAVPEITVRRDGKEGAVSASKLVPGDVILLMAGNRIPADCRLLESRQLQLEEAALTGESHTVVKHVKSLDEADLPLGDRKNMVFMGTDVSSGRGVAVVTETGMNTELGNIADLIQRVGYQSTPLQRRLARMGKWLAVAALALVAVVFGMGILRGQDVPLMLMTALSMAVAAVPEGLIAVATISLALGAKRMLRREALIRKLPAVETLGSVTVICSDKTGTLTENRMALNVLRHSEFEFDVHQIRENDEGGSEIGDKPNPGLVERPVLALGLLAGALCNDANLKGGDPQPKGALEADGDPTEGALVVAAARFGLCKPDLEALFPRVAEAPFDSVRKRMTTVHKMSEEIPANGSALQWALESAFGMGSGSHFAVLKGAVDAVLDVCTMDSTTEGCLPLDQHRRKQHAKANDDLAASGRRVMGLAFRWLDRLPKDDSAKGLERDFVFMGMAGLVDPPRREAAEAVDRCKSAGIRPIMITGDHPLTAQFIANEVGILHDNHAVTGKEIEQKSDAELEQLVEEATVYARVSPEHKLRIVRALQKRDEVVAMTGDGVNDGPALKTADIGVAMGITGTDVAKEASDMVLRDDNFATIVNAVEEGRIIYDNIRKFLQYTMTSNTGEIWVMLVAPFLGMPLPLVPLQILWINLITDGLPGLALAIEPGERGVMRRPPRRLREPILGSELVRHILLIGVLMGFVSLASGYFYWQGNPTTEYDPSWGTIVFTVLTLSQLGHALAVRSSVDSLFSIGLFSNPAMLGTVGLTIVLQLAVIYVPFLQQLFRTTALSGIDLLFCLVLSTVVFWVVEGWKCGIRRKRG